MVIRIGIVGTGYAARARAKAIEDDGRSRLVAVASQDFRRAEQFAHAHDHLQDQVCEVRAVETWRSLVLDDALDLVIVATVSSLHGDIVEAALEAGKHVVVEYPLSLDVEQAARLVALAAQKEVLLHVEHIELLGGLHRAMQAGIAKIGEVKYINYRTLNPQNPAPRKWTYNKALFGFAYFGALSRVQRLVNVLGDVSQVSCCTRYVGEGEDGWFRGVLSSARLAFVSGAVAEVTYGKGEGLWLKRREIEAQGSLGAVSFVGNDGKLVTADGERAIAVEPRKGLFKKDMDAVLSYLTEHKPLYVSAAESLYALSVADALRRASERQELVNVKNA